MKLEGHCEAMLSGKLIQLIEDHQEQITDSLIHEIRHHPDLVHLRKVPDAELRERGQLILQNLGHWLAAGHEQEIAETYEKLGKSRFEHDVPLHESVRVLLMTKEKMISFISHQGLAKTPIELYAEEELDRRVGRFFDMLVIHLVRGYEMAWQHGAAFNAQARSR
jgi:hypothetical protein